MSFAEAGSLSRTAVSLSLPGQRPIASEPGLAPRACDLTSGTRLFKPVCNFPDRLAPCFPVQIFVSNEISDARPGVQPLRSKKKARRSGQFKGCNGN